MVLRDSCFYGRHMNPFYVYVCKHVHKLTCLLTFDAVLLHFSGASHSAVADMQCITQEAPSNAAARHGVDRYMPRSTRDRDFDDDFELIRSGPPRYDAVTVS